ncbi:MAG: hypothetical protein K0Q67_3063 [Cellvibrio sp.]|nr:hypothetical protein [Cellvibrio sp.]
MLALPSNACAIAKPSWVVDATAGRFDAKLPTGFTITLLALDAEDFEDVGAIDEDGTIDDVDDFDEAGAIDEVVTTLLELLTEEDEGATLLELLDDELPTLELAAPAIENFIQFRLIA